MSILFVIASGCVCDAIKYSVFGEKLHQTRQNLCEKTPKIDIVALLCHMSKFVRELHY